MNSLLEKCHAALRRATKYHHDCGDNKEFLPVCKRNHTFFLRLSPQSSYVQQTEERAILLATHPPIFCCKREFTMLTAPQAPFLLFHPFLLGIRNRFFRDQRISLRTAAVLALGAGLFIALYLVSLRMIGYFHSQSELGMDDHVRHADLLLDGLGGLLALSVLGQRNPMQCASG
jgi:hypothetical protein